MTDAGGLRGAHGSLGVQSRELVDWIEFESSGFDCPSFADELVGCEAFEDLQSPSEIVGADEVGGMPAELIMAVVVVAFDVASLMVRFIRST